ncbi:MAG TPA: sirohydrochlorin chelatase [Xenococcaceae cyanobacterium]
MPLSSASAFLLVYHGSRDPRPKVICQQLAHYFQQKLKRAIWELQNKSLHSPDEPSYYDAQISLASTASERSPLVETVALELATLPLHQNIAQFAQKAIALNKRNLIIIPLFLSLGVHVRQDIPSEIALAQSQIPQQLKIQLNPPLGSYKELNQLLLAQFEAHSASARILLAHGSRLATANQLTEHLAEQCTAQVAYWAISPDLEAVVSQQLADHPKTITIIPYFLFPGKTTDAIAEKVAQLQQQYPQTQLMLGQPLGATPTLAQLILDKITA